MRIMICTPFGNQTKSGVASSRFNSGVSDQRADKEQRLLELTGKVRESGPWDHAIESRGIIARVGVDKADRTGRGTVCEEGGPIEEI
jgi:hypothetical protein